MLNIIKYFESGVIDGIDTAIAKKIVDKFSFDIFSAIEDNPKLLFTIEGLNNNAVESICNSWNNQKSEQGTIFFLSFCGIGFSVAKKIYKRYKKNTINVVLRNPYRLSYEISGIGFIYADKIANAVGIKKNSLIRCNEYINYILLKSLQDGHCGLPLDYVKNQAIIFLKISENDVANALNESILLQKLVIENCNNVVFIFLVNYYIYEQYISRCLLYLIKSNVINDNKFDTSHIQKKLNVHLSQQQQIAIEHAMLNRVFVITGGPGTGKTTLIKILSSLLEDKLINFKLCAPTGRAAKRLSESSGFDAFTIHRLLGLNNINAKFKYNTFNKLTIKYLIIDEASMISVHLFYHLLKALPKDISLLIIGDIDQLPSIGAGQVLKDIIDSNVIPFMKLDYIFRQSSSNNIASNAHLINNGMFPKTSKFSFNLYSGLYFINMDNNVDILNKIISLTKDVIPNKFGYNYFDIQVLCPTNNGIVGVKSLNTYLQKSLNSNYIDGIKIYDKIFAIQDKVMQIENNYDKGVYNGDIGRVIDIDKKNNNISISFDNNKIVYDVSEMYQINLSYAMSIHKSQGSEYPVVIIPMSMQSFIMLKRQLLYTAVTRAKELVIIIGQKKALAISIKNSKNFNRYTRLKQLLLELKQI